MLKIVAKANEAKNGFSFPSEYNKSRLLEWMKKYTYFEITPVVRESKKSRKYLEAAVIPEYCKWQYEIDPRDPKMAETRRFLFKRDFAYEVVKNRKGEPVRAPQSTQGRAGEVLNTYTEWAQENGAPIPNPELFKMYRDVWSMDKRFNSYHDWLAFLGIEGDAMPSAQTFNKLNEKNTT